MSAPRSSFLSAGGGMARPVDPPPPPAPAAPAHRHKRRRRGNVFEVDSSKHSVFLAYMPDRMTVEYNGLANHTLDVGISCASARTATHASARAASRHHRHPHHGTATTRTHRKRTHTCCLHGLLLAWHPPATAARVLRTGRSFLTPSHAARCNYPFPDGVGIGYFEVAVEDAGEAGCVAMRVYSWPFASPPAMRPPWWAVARPVTPGARACSLVQPSYCRARGGGDVTQHATRLRCKVCSGHACAVL